AFDKDIGIDEDKYLYIKLKATDQENDDLTYYILTPPNHGSITKTNDTVLYTPNPHYNGPDSFTYKANDSHDDSNTASIMITIYPIYDPPVAHALNITTCENIPKNLILTAFSPDNLPLTFQIKDQPTHGILSQGTPYITYTPDTHFYGTDSFTFTANDSISNSLPAAVTIQVDRSKTYT
ncbi:MAG: hypothetical protein OMM_15330, partial [Candidatus Magnetoglobus multicellularis str. Araruama]